MRSSRKPTKSVSICSEPVTELTENGPCSKKENDDAGHEEGKSRQNGVDELELKAVAAQVVQDVVAQAPDAARERFSERQQQYRDDGEDDDSCDLPPHPPSSPPMGSSEPQTSSYSHAKHDVKALRRLPTIQIDTVPSMPPSPTEWPSPPPEATIKEEDEEGAVNEESIHLGFEQEGAYEQTSVHQYAAKYIDELLERAVDVADEKKKAQDVERAREVAAQVVDDVISLASESAAKKSGLDFTHAEGLPTFQIDTVASIPPSPASDEDKGSIQGDDKTQQIRRDIPQITYDFSEDIKNEDDDEEVQEKDSSSSQDVAKTRLVKYKDAPIQLQEFAKSYIKDVIVRAITVAEEKAIQSVPFSFDDVDLMKTNGPWYIRVREAFMRVFRSACFCTPRRNDS